jgi:alpha-ribazole phosphatase/probable phosphoglycerate mutase
MKKVYLVRHGETLWNAEKKYLGLTDIGLTKNGLSQAERLAQRLEGEGIEVIFTSPLLRAKETASLIAGKLKVQVEVWEELKEVDFGEWEGLTYEEIREKYGDLINKWMENPSAFSIPGGDSWEEINERAKRFLKKIQERKEEVALAVSHGGLIKAIFARVLHMHPPDFTSFLIGNGSLSAIGFHGRGIYRNTHAIFINDTYHLE